MPHALARLQQATTLGALLLAAGWAWWCLQGGHPGWALAGVVVVLGGYAMVMALEFTLLHLAHGDDPTPRATGAQLLRAWWGEVRSAPVVFCWRQPFRSRLHPDHLPVAPGTPGGQRGVLLIHGFVCNRGLWNPWLHKMRRDGVPFVAVNLEPVFGGIDHYVQPIEAAVQRLEQATGLAPVVVAHSMGGLALRRWCAEPGHTARIHHAITIGTPHQGTWLARFATMSLNSGDRCARPQPLAGHAWLQRETTGPVHSVLPASTATATTSSSLPSGRHLAGGRQPPPGRRVAHVHMADHPAPWAELLRRISLLMPQPGPPAR